MWSFLLYQGNVPERLGGIVERARRLDLVLLSVPPLLALAVVSCGGSKHAAPATRSALTKHAASVCTPQARAVVARASGGSVTQSQSTGNNAMPQCSYRASRVTVIANVDTSPQPFFRLERAIVEEGQQFSTVRNEPAPQRVAHLGLDASWFPAEHLLLTGNNQQLLTVTVKWPHASRARMKALGAAVARVYLGRQPARGG
jgi:hypothetical protein